MAINICFWGFTGFDNLLAHDIRGHHTTRSDETSEVIPSFNKSSFEMFLFEVGLDCLGAVEDETTLEGSAPGCANAFKDGANHCENDGSDYDRDLPIDQHKWGLTYLRS